MPESGNGGAALEQQIRQQKASLQAAQDAQQQQLRQQASGLNEQLQAARRELLQIEAEAATRQRQTRLAREKLARYQSLEKAGAASAVSVQEQQSAVFEHEAQTQTLLRQAASTRRLLAQLEQALRELPSQRAAARANHARDMAQLEQSEVQVRMDNRLAVTAPVAGVIAAQLVRPGQAVQAGQPLLSLLPGQGTLQAHLLAPSRAVGFIEPGDKVMLRYQAYPYQKFGHHTGRVASISRSALTRSELQALSSVYQGDEPVYRITVDLPRQYITAYGRHENLKPGMLLDADIMGEKRRLIEWLVEPLYSVAGKVGECGMTNALVHKTGAAIQWARDYGQAHPKIQGIFWIISTAILTIVPNELVKFIWKFTGKNIAEFAVTAITIPILFVLQKEQCRKFMGRRIPMLALAGILPAALWLCFNRKVASM